MSMFKQKAGKKGEDAAVDYLQDRGFTVIARNFRIRGGEIDIVAIDSSAGRGQEVLVFVEVKTRSSNDFGTPLEAITHWKLKSLIKTAQVYKLKNPRLPDSMRIDAVAITLDEDKIKDIELVKNIS